MHGVAGSFSIEVPGPFSEVFDEDSSSHTRESAQGPTGACPMIFHKCSTRKLD